MKPHDLACPGDHSRRIDAKLTDDQRDVDAIVKSHAGEESANGEGPEGPCTRGRDGRQQSEAVAQHQGGDASPVISDPSEEEAAHDRAAEEDRLCRRHEILPVAYPI